MSAGKQIADEEILLSVELLTIAQVADSAKISAESTDTKLTAVQVQELDLCDSQEKVVVADSRYQDHQLLRTHVTQR